MNVGAVSSTATTYAAQAATRPNPSNPASRPAAQDKIELSSRATGGVDTDHDGDSH